MRTKHEIPRDSAIIAKPSVFTYFYIKEVVYERRIKNIDHEIEETPEKRDFEEELLQLLQSNEPPEQLKNRPRQLSRQRYRGGFAETDKSRTSETL